VKNAQLCITSLKVSSLATNNSTTPFAASPLNILLGGDNDNPKLLAQANHTVHGKKFCFSIRCTIALAFSVSKSNIGVKARRLVRHAQLRKTLFTA